MAPSSSAQGAFSAQAEAIPFPPDAREVAFDATFDGIEFTSGSSLASLADFYRRELAKRGWEEDKSAAETDDDSAEMTFTHEDAELVIELDEGSDETDVSFDCEGVDFSHTNDPAAMVAAGVPQPRSYLFLQKEIPRPPQVIDEEYSDDATHFKSPLAPAAAFDFYNTALKAAGWRETRKPIIESDRRYTEFQKGPVEVSVNIFSHEVGSRIILDYENGTKEPIVPPLADVASADGDEDSEGGDEAADDEGDDDEPPSGKSQAAVAVDVSHNAGSATVTLGAKATSYKYVAAYRTKDDGDSTTKLVFCNRAIPFQKLQAELAKGEDVSISDLYEFGFPGHLTVSYGDYVSFTFNDGGVGIGNSLEKTDCDIKIENGRVRGVIKMAEPREFFDDKFLIAATIDAAVMTPRTMLGAAPPPQAVAARQSPFPESEQLLPDGAGNVQSEGSRYSLATKADVDLGVAAVTAFYRKELASRGWKEVASPPAAASATTLNFQKPTGSMTITLSGSADRTHLDISSRNDAKAREDGMLPEPGKGRIVLASAHTQNVVVMIGKQSYPLKAGQGTANPKQALNYSVAPGKYELTIIVPGRPQQHETVNIPAGQAWAVMVLPGGEYLANQLY